MLSASAVGRVTPAFEVIKACLGCNWCCCLLKYMRKTVRFKHWDSEMTTR